ncbi:hypothetical protein Y032_0940g3136 [Ancylostoma ceylanicum]|uniref:Uncharacterized protein n=1 Tax=Ancylostoma ceylanicum TaxID=53326 RepID=A0A016W8Z7_9BILA|nr:hypothetical protein Y032_0940g3136 [Ancylostoma ceylanicum]
MIHFYITGKTSKTEEPWKRYQNQRTHSVKTGFLGLLECDAILLSAEVVLLWRTETSEFVLVRQEHYHTQGDCLHF